MELREIRRVGLSSVKEEILAHIYPEERNGHIWYSHTIEEGSVHMNSVYYILIQNAKQLTTNK